MLADPALAALGDAAAAETDAETWAAESHELAKLAVYAPEVLAFLPVLKAAPPGPPPVLTLSPAYLSEGGKLARTRLVVAGRRLATALE